jgi:hypothetical protein
LHARKRVGNVAQLVEYKQLVFKTSLQKWITCKTDRAVAGKANGKRNTFRAQSGSSRQRRIPLSGALALSKDKLTISIARESRETVGAKEAQFDVRDGTMWALQATVF